METNMPKIYRFIAFFNNKLIFKAPILRQKTRIRHHETEKIEAKICRSPLRGLLIGNKENTNRWHRLKRSIFSLKSE